MLPRARGIDRIRETPKVAGDNSQIATPNVIRCTFNHDEASVTAHPSPEHSYRINSRLLPCLLKLECGCFQKRDQVAIIGAWYREKWRSAGLLVLEDAQEG